MSVQSRPPHSCFSGCANRGLCGTGRRKREEGIGLMSWRRVRGFICVNPFRTRRWRKSLEPGDENDELRKSKEFLRIIILLGEPQMGNWNDKVRMITRILWGKNTPVEGYLPVPLWMELFRRSDRLYKHPREAEGRRHIIDEHPRRSRRRRELE